MRFSFPSNAVTVRPRQLICLLACTLFLSWFSFNSLFNPLWSFYIVKHSTNDFDYQHIFIPSSLFCHVESVVSFGGFIL